MTFVAKDAKAYQVFRGGLNDLNKNPWLQNIGGDCCEPTHSIDQDRLNRTINPENALVHSRPFGNRLYWQYSEHDNSEKAKILRWINEQGVGAQLEIIVIPTFGFLYSVHVAVLAEELGFTYELKTRNGTVLPDGQLIKVSETDSADGCGEVGRVQEGGDFADLGALDGATRVHTIGVSGQGGEFALNSDVLILEVLTLPADGLKGTFDLRVHSVTVAAGRSEATR